MNVPNSKLNCLSAEYRIQRPLWMLFRALKAPVFVQESWYYSNLSVRFLAGAFFTTQFNLILSLTNIENDSGIVSFNDGSFDCEKLVYSICQMVYNKFPNAGFRHKRRILMDYGKMLTLLMHRIEPQISISDFNIATTKMIARLDSYEQLIDVDFIEDCPSMTLNKKTKRVVPLRLANLILQEIYKPIFFRPCELQVKFMSIFFRLCDFGEIFSKL